MKRPAEVRIMTCARQVQRGVAGTVGNILHHTLPWERITTPVMLGAVRGAVVAWGNAWNREAWFCEGARHGHRNRYHRQLVPYSLCGNWPMPLTTSTR